MSQREWKLVAPWYRWKQQLGPGVTPRETRPVFQKYETGDLVNAFLKDPQRSLKWSDDDLSIVYEPVARLTNAHFSNALTRFVPPAGGAASPPAESVAKPGTTRKLFLDSHKRFYLVVCELHCDAPGFPTASRDEACEAGFVVRRRRTVMSEGKQKEAARILKDVESASSNLQKIAARMKADLDARRGISRKQLIQASLTSPLQIDKSKEVERLRAAQDKLKAWGASDEVEPLLEGWVPSGFDRVGSWQTVDEEPEEVTEQIFPLYPLVADPRDEAHSGAGKTIYFGLVPTGSADTTDDGTARFDPQSTYEIRCFVRRHQANCPKKPGRNDCHGELVWTRPTEAYQIAPHFDLVGTSNRPVTMQLPDVPALAAQAASLPPAKVAPFRMASPNPSSNLGFDVDTDAQKGTAQAPGAMAEICSFAIPLITIVATFVLKLFLPIVTFVFGLFFLLKLKFCIPPSFSLDAGVSAALAIDAPSIDLDIDLSVQIGASATADLAVSLGLSASATDGEVTDALQAKLQGDLDKALAPGVYAKISASGTTYTNEALLEADAGAWASTSGDEALSVTGNLEYEAPVLQAEVHIS